jgi:hypothetical protein
MRSFFSRFALYGMLIMLAASVVALHRGAGDFLSPRGGVVELAVAAAFALMALLVNADRLARYLSPRRFVTIVNVTVMCVLAGGLVVFANVLAARHYRVFDETLKGSYSITERTRHVIETLPRKVVVRVIVTPYNPYMINIRGMLDAYHAVAPDKVEVQYINVGQDRDETERKLMALGIDPKKLNGPDVVVFEGVDPDARVPRTKVVDLEDLVEIDYSLGPQSARLKGFKGEEQFTKALLDVTREKATTVYFLAGHMELDVSGSAANERVKSLDTALRNLNYDVKPLKLDFAPDSKAREVPEDCDVLAIFGPRSRFDDKELGAIRAYLDRGGRVLLMAEPVVKQRPGTTSVYFDETRLDELLKPYGLALGQALIHDPATAPADFVFRARFEGAGASHPITRPLRGLDMWFATALPLTVLEPAPPGVTVEPIVQSEPSAVSVRDLDAVAHGRDPETVADKKGPFVLAAAVTRALEPATATAEPAAEVKREARLVVTGDASIASDELTSRFREQLNFVLNAIAWLAQREETISIASKPPEILHLTLGPGDATRLELTGLLEVPLFCAAIALFVWISRRA